MDEFSWLHYQARTLKLSPWVQLSKTLLSSVVAGIHLPPQRLLTARVLPTRFLGSLYTGLKINPCPLLCPCWVPCPQQAQPGSCHHRVLLAGSLCGPIWAKTPAHAAGLQLLQTWLSPTTKILWGPCQGLWPEGPCLGVVLAVPLEDALGPGTSLSHSHTGSSPDLIALSAARAPSFCYLAELWGTPALLLPSW